MFVFLLFVCLGSLFYCFPLVGLVLIVVFGFLDFFLFDFLDIVMEARTEDFFRHTYGLIADL